MSAEITEEDKQKFLNDFVAVSEEEIEHAKEVKQRSVEWYKYKEHRIGMSNAGAAAGHNSEHKSQYQVLKEMLWGSNFSNEAMMYGTTMEDTGIAMMQIVIKSHFRQLGYNEVWVESTGTWIWKEYPWLSASSDGLIYAIDGPHEKPTVLGTVENKCPIGHQFYPKVPHYYYDQFQGTAIITNAEFIIFNVYTPTSTQINWYDVDKKYWMTEVFPKLESFYHNLYIPRAILKQRGLLKEGEIDLNPIVIIEPSLLKGTRSKKRKSLYDKDTITNMKNHAEGDLQAEAEEKKQKKSSSPNCHSLSFCAE